MLEGGGIAAPLAIFPALNAAAANIFKNIINISIIDIYFIKFFVFKNFQIFFLII